MATVSGSFHQSKIRKGVVDCGGCNYSHIFLSRKLSGILNKYGILLINRIHLTPLLEKTKKPPDLHFWNSGGNTATTANWASDNFILNSWQWRISVEKETKDMNWKRKQKHFEEFALSPSESLQNAESHSLLFSQKSVVLPAQTYSNLMPQYVVEYTVSLHCSKPSGVQSEAGATGVHSSNTVFCLWSRQVILR